MSVSRQRRLLLLGGLCAVLPAIAQRAAPRIGFLSVVAIAKEPHVPAFVAALRDKGYVEGKSIFIDWRSAQGDVERLRPLAEELVSLKPALIVAVQPSAVEAVRRTTTTIPIVFAVGQDPVGMGFAKSLSRPGGNITGASSMTAELAPKQVELLRAALPQCNRLALLLNPDNPRGSAVLRARFDMVAAKNGFSLLVLYARQDTEVTAALTHAKRERADALVVGADSYFLQASALIAQNALANRLPTMFVQAVQAHAGGLMSYGHRLEENYVRAAHYVDRILKGAKPGELPIEQPTNFQFVVNLKSAKALGLSIPQAVLARADEVVR